MLLADLGADVVRVDRPDSSPIIPPGGDMFPARGVRRALWESRAWGRGQGVDAAIVDGAATLATMTYSMLASGLWRDERGANLLDTGAPYYDVYQTADGRHMAVGAIE